MRKPDGYDNAQAYTGEFEKIKPGGYICVIKNVREEATDKKWQLAIALDIAEGDSKDYYKQRFDRFGGNWPAIYRQNIAGKDGRCSPFFKGMITAIEESNPDFTFRFEDEKCLVGKIFGGVFGEEEFVGSNGDTAVSCKCVQVRSVQAIRDGNFKIPDRKPLPAPAAAKPVSLDDFRDISIDDCPF